MFASDMASTILTRFETITEIFDVRYPAGTSLCRQLALGPGYTRTGAARETLLRDLNRRYDHVTSASFPREFIDTVAASVSMNCSVLRDKVIRIIPPEQVLWVFLLSLHIVPLATLQVDNVFLVK